MFLGHMSVAASGDIFLLGGRVIGPLVRMTFAPSVKANFSVLSVIYGRSVFPVIDRVYIGRL